MTGYYISLGYMSGSREGAKEALEQIVDDLRANPTRIFSEFVKEPAMSNKTLPEAAEYLRRYRLQDDLSCRFREDPENGLQLVQLASGYGAERVIKESVRRAVCRIVIFEMHCRGFEVNLLVA